MPRTSVRPVSNLPSFLLASAGLLLGVALVHDAIDRRILTSESIFSSPVAAILATLGIGMAGVLIWDILSSRRSR